MEDLKENVKYPENLPLKDKVKSSGKTVKFIAKELKISRRVLSDVINGNYKGGNIIPKLENYLSN